MRRPMPDRLGGADDLYRPRRLYLSSGLGNHLGKNPLAGLVSYLVSGNFRNYFLPG